MRVTHSSLKMTFFFSLTLLSIQLLCVLNREYNSERTGQRGTAAPQTDPALLSWLVQLLWLFAGISEKILVSFVFLSDV